MVSPGRSFIVLLVFPPHLQFQFPYAPLHEVSLPPANLSVSYPVWFLLSKQNVNAFFSIGIYTEIKIISDVRLNTYRELNYYFKS